MKKNCIFLLCLFLTMGLQAKNFYISTNGNDSNSGSKSKPWRTPKLAVERVLDYMRNNPDKPAQLIILGGEYYINEAIEIDGKGINAPFTITSEKGEDVNLRADIKLRGWQKCNNPKLLSLLDKETADCIYQIDLKSLGVTNLGEPSGTSNRVDLYCDGKRQILARWPNKGFTKAGQARGVKECEKSWLNTWITDATADGVLEYLDDRIDKWADENEPCAFGYWHWDWSEQYHEIERIDTKTRTLYIKPPYHQYGYRAGCRFYGFNLLCELDGEGEYYIDRQSGMLYWYAPKAIDLSKSKLTLSHSAPQYMFKVKDMNDFSLYGINMQGSRGGGIDIINSNRCLIYDCEIRQFAQRAINISGGKDNCIDNCTLEDLGHDGIYLQGGNSKTLEPCNHKVTNTTVRNFSLYQRTYQPAVCMVGVGFVVSHNRFEESSSSAIRIEANDCLIEYNQVFRVVTESDDQGGIDMYLNFALRGNVMRYNHWRDITGGTHCGSAGIRFDDIISGQTVYGNIFENVGGVNFGGVQIHGGKDNVVDNNLFYNCSIAVSFNLWSDQTWDERYNSKQHIHKIQHLADINSEIYLNRYPELRTPHKENHNRNFVRNNLIVKTPSITRGDGGQNVLENNTLLNDEKAIQPMSHYLQPKVLKQYGLTAIPFDNIGPQKKPTKTRSRK